MKTIEWLVIGALLTSPITLAQEPNAYVGTWDVRMESKKGGALDGKVILQDQEGTWDIYWSNPNDACTGLKAPIVVISTSTDELVFEILKSKAMRGCSDDVATLKRVNDTTLQGELGDGRKLTLIKK